MCTFHFSSAYSENALLFKIFTDFLTTKCNGLGISMYHSTEVESKQSFDTELLQNIAVLFFLSGSGVCWLISLECYVQCLKFIVFLILSVVLSHILPLLPRSL